VAGLDVLRSVQHNGIDVPDAEAAGHFHRCRYGSCREYRVRHGSFKVRDAHVRNQRREITRG
jgi:hypothetical protein